MASLDKELRNSIEILPDRLYFVSLSTPPSSSTTKHFFCIDNDLLYWNFFLDFGPLNLGHLYRFCALLNHKLNDSKLKDKVLYYFSGSHIHRRTNAAYLMSAWSMLYLVKTPEEAYKPFKPIHHTFSLWHDATPSPCLFQLTILDTLKGLYKARECKFFDFNKFNIEEYEYFEQVENGDLNWCMDGKFVAFAGPHATKEVHPGGYHTLCPDDYVQYFKKKNVQLVIRLNKKYYDAKRFTNHGISHMELYFLDGSNPPDNILAAFLRACEQSPGAIAVHCKAGLGRTGSCIGSYMMKHFKFTAEEVIGWLRIVRPGSIIGPQQQFMKDTQMKMWREGDIFRSKIVSMPPADGGETSERDSRTDGIVVKNSKSLQEHKASSSSGSSAGTPTKGLVSGITSMTVTGSGRERPDDSFGEEGYSQGDSLRAARIQATRAGGGVGSSGTSSSGNSKKANTNSQYSQFLSSWK